ncbi:HAMP domain-containing histidine kinase [Neobacillus pocheonensis]|uniref:histidine kinase n=1 Tax=Neobacillus pocheonensis TaxID=363869 RepID=A0ABT0WIW6_9BACI|nr:HAMP domain-containing histidine kinase [Neobacillus pocheonensis]
MGTELMTKIGSKLLLTYFLLIISIFLITSLSFHFISQRYLINGTEQQLQKEANVISQWLSKGNLSRSTIQAKLVNRKVLAISERLTSSKMIIWTGNQNIIYSDLTAITLNQLEKQSKGPGRKFVTETVEITAKNGRTKGYVTLFAKIEDIKEINKLMRNSQLISLIISAIIAIVLGIFFEKSLTKPIRLLTAHLRNYTVRGSNEEISIRTKDEIGELADSFNALSRKIKRYDEDQKVFFQNASHELKTPLMAIQGNAEGILDGVVTGEDAKHSLNVIIAESQRLKKIVESVTYLAKLESVEESFRFAEESLERVILDAVDSVAAIAEQKGIEILVKNDVTGSVLMDREKMKRAFINLLGNAIRYAESEIVVYSMMRSVEEIIIEIVDNGSGFAPGEEKKVFQRFYSGDTGGSGIGLAITKAIIEGHNGTITASRAEPKGALFRISLPNKE